MSDGDPVPNVPRREAEGDADALWTASAAAFRDWMGGRPGAMDDLVRLMTPVLRHVVRAYGLTRDLAQDVVQTTWLTLVHRAAAATAGTGIRSSFLCHGAGW